MLVLAIESSTAAGSVAISRDGKILAFEKSMNQRAHSEMIHPAIQKCLTTIGLSLSQMDVFAVGVGPGSFTGIRVAMNTGMALAMTFQKPMVTMTSLEILKLQAGQDSESAQQTLCLLNAHKNMCYLALFENESLILGPTALPVKEIETLPLKSSQVLGLGEGFKAYEKVWSSSFLNKFRFVSEGGDYPLASTLAIAAEERAKNGQTIEWKMVKPLYIRASEAEENLRLNT